MPLHLDVSTPDRQFYDGPVDAVVIPLLDGLYGVEPGHIAMVTTVEPGTLKYKVDGTWLSAAVTHGIAEIMPNKVVLLLSAAEKPEEIDLDRAQKAIRRAEERMKRHQASMREYYSSQAALSRAMARIKTTKI